VETKIVLRKIAKGYSMALFLVLQMKFGNFLSTNTYLTLLKIKWFEIITMKSKL